MHTQREDQKEAGNGQHDPPSLCVTYQQTGPDWSASRPRYFPGPQTHTFSLEFCYMEEQNFLLHLPIYLYLYRLMDMNFTPRVKTEVC